MIIVSYAEGYPKYCPRGCCNEGFRESQCLLAWQRTREEAAEYIAHLNCSGEGDKEDWTHLVFENGKQMESEIKDRRESGDMDFDTYGGGVELFLPSEEEEYSKYRIECQAFEDDVKRHMKSIKEEQEKKQKAAEAKKKEENAEKREQEELRVLRKLIAKHGNTDPS